MTKEVCQELLKELYEKILKAGVKIPFYMAIFDDYGSLTYKLYEEGQTTRLLEYLPNDRPSSFLYFFAFDTEGNHIVAEMKPPQKKRPILTLVKSQSQEGNPQ